MSSVLQQETALAGQRKTLTLLPPHLSLSPHLYRIVSDADLERQIAEINNLGMLFQDEIIPKEGYLLRPNFEKLNIESGRELYILTFFYININLYHFNRHFSKTELFVDVDHTLVERTPEGYIACQYFEYFEMKDGDTIATASAKLTTVGNKVFNNLQDLIEDEHLLFLSEKCSNNDNNPIKSISLKHVSDLNKTPEQYLKLMPLPKNLNFFTTEIDVILLKWSPTKLFKLLHCDSPVEQEFVLKQLPLERISDSSYVKMVEYCFLNRHRFCHQEISRIENKMIAYRFSDNYILDIKSFGHRFSLPGAVQTDHTENSKVNFPSIMENFYSMGKELCNSFDDFIQEFGPELDHNSLAVFQKIQIITRRALWYYFLLDNANFLENKNEILNNLLTECKQDIVLIHTGYPLHSIAISIIQGKSLRIYNKGGCKFDGYIIEEYEITKPYGLTTELLSDLYANRNREINKYLIHQDLHVCLGLKLISMTKGAPQTVGNCSWASKKAAAQDLVDYLYSQVRGPNLLNRTIHDNKEQNETAFIERSSQDPYHKIYKAFTEFDLRRTFERFIEKYKQSYFLPYVLWQFIVTRFKATPINIELGLKAVQYLKNCNNYQLGFIDLLICQWELRKNIQKRDNFLAFLKIIGLEIPERIEELPLLVQIFHASIHKQSKKLIELLNLYTHQGKKLEELHFIGWNPLHIALGNQDYDSVKILLSVYPDWVLQKNYRDETTLFFLKNIEGAKLIFSYFQHDKNRYTELINSLSIGPDFFTPLESAIDTQESELVEYLLNLGCSISGESIRRAAITGSVRIFEHLTKKDRTCIFFETYSKSSPLHISVANGHLPLTKYLLQNKVNVNARDIHGDTPFHRALKSSQTEFIKMFLSVSETDLKAKNYRGFGFSYFAHYKKDKITVKEIEKIMNDKAKLDPF